MRKDLAFLVAAFVGSIITLIVSIAVNTTVANVPGNDLGRNTGWVILTPAPAISLVWTVIDVAVYRLWVYHCIYWLVTTVLLASINIAFGVSGILMYSWDNDGAWVAGMFELLFGLFYVVSLSFAAIAVHHWRAQQGLTRATPKDVDLSDPNHA